MRRALVLGSGGATGVAWTAGLLAGLAESGVDPAGADLIVGTSGGALLAAGLALGESAESLVGATLAGERLGRVTAVAAGRLALAQLWPSRAAAVRWLGRVAVRGDRDQERWVESVAGHVAGRAWPDRLVVVATAVSSGVGVVWDSSSGVALERALAASCAVPGVFPPVSLAGADYFDGALRSPANADLARGCAALVAAPMPAAVLRSRRAAVQAAGLPRALVLTPAGVRIDVLSVRAAKALVAAGREQGRRAAPVVARLWA